MTLVNGNEVTLDEPVPTLEVAGNYAIRFCSDLNVSYVRTVQTDPGEQTTITLTGMGRVPKPGERTLTLFPHGTPRSPSRSIFARYHPKP